MAGHGSTRWLNIVVLCAIAAAAPAGAALRSRGGRDATLGEVATDAAAGALLPVTLARSGNVVTLANGFTQLEFDLDTAQVTGLRGDALGAGTFSASNVAAAMGGALALEVTDAEFVTHSSASVARASPLAYTVLEQSDDAAAFRVQGVTDATSSSALVSAAWEFGLSRTSRALEFNSSAVPLGKASVVSVRLSWYFTPVSTYAFFDDGVMQSMQQAQPYFASAEPYSRVYAMGPADAGAVDVRPNTAVAPLPPQSVIINGIWNEQRSGLAHVYAGSLPTETWVDGWESSTPVDIAPVPTGSFAPWNSSLFITPNDAAYPSGDVPTGASALPAADLQAVLSAVYGSPAGALVSHAFAPEGRITPCIGTPGRCYADLYNFFDPDSFLSITAMSYAGDAYLLNEAKKLLETNLAYICKADTPNLCQKGQLPHHFIPEGQCVHIGNDASPLLRSVLPDLGDFKPGCTCYNVTRKYGGADSDCLTYMAISGASQTGPNIFVALSALQYVATSGDMAWLKEQMPNLRLSFEFLMAMYDSTYGLINAPGSLWIDTFKRSNFTTDSNAAFVLLCGRLAEAEAALGNATGAAKLTSLASNVSAAMNTHLWSSANNHYVTQANPPATTGGPLTVRDFEDFDSNLLAIAAGVAPPDRAAAILSFIDAFPCSHARATYVSGVYYNASNCFGNNTGDSAVTMGRIAWADGRARRAVGGDAAASFFSSSILGPLQGDLTTNTWMYERYTCSAAPTHNPFYIEYPEVVAMLLAEVKYGLDFGVASVTVQPLVAHDFSWVVGSMDIQYSSVAFSASLSMPGARTFRVHGVKPGVWTVSTETATGLPSRSTTSVVVGPDGILTFSATTGPGRIVRATAGSSLARAG